MLERLSERGLIFEDQEKAKSVLKFISYYRFTGYGLSFEVYDGNKKRLNIYKNGTRFEDILYRYDFDRQLRILVGDAIERVEIAIRTCITQTLAIKYKDSHWILNQNLFKSNYDQPFLIEKIKKEIGYNSPKKIATGEVFIRHYFKTYKEPSLPASWMVAEVLTIGNWSILFENLGKLKDQKEISRIFDLPVDELISWLHALTYLRNLYAHHSRIFNRHFIIKPKFSQKIPVHLKNDRFAYFAAILLYFLNKISPEHHWNVKLDELFKKYPLINIEELGFTINWRNDKFWGLTT